MSKDFVIESANFSKGYLDDGENAAEGYLYPPSKNCRITLAGVAVSRLGYEDTLIDFGEALKTLRSYHMTQYNITFLSGNGKVKYIDWDRGTVVDTGLSLTTTETTTFSEYAGDIYTINQTDGVRQIHVMKINDLTPNSGDATVTVDQNGAARLTAFSHTSGNLRIRGTNEAYTSANTNGVITLTGTLSQTYTNREIALMITTVAATVPKGTMMTFWKERATIIGSIYDVNTDNTAQIAYMSQFGSGRDIQKVMVFGNTGGATEEWIGKSGILTNVVTTRDYMYFFKEDETYFSSVASVDTTSGATSPQLLSNNYGTYSKDTAADIGGRIVFLTKNKRVISIDISTDSGAALVFPNEKFDQAIRKTLELLDTDQSKARMFYHKGSRILYLQVSVQSVIITLPYDNNIGKWLPPDDNKQFSSFFEKDGILYATDLYDDAIYEIDRGFTDADQSIDCVMAHGLFKYGNSRTTCEWKDIELSGSLSQDATLTIETSVNNGTSTQKVINASDLSFANAISLSDISIGDLIIGGVNTEIKLANWDRKFRIAPTSYGNVYQTILSSTYPFTWNSYKIVASALPSSLLITS